jgi:hypothetical protein
MAVVDLALRYGFVDRMDVASAELDRLGWVGTVIDGDGTCLDREWNYLPSSNLWRVHTGRVGAEFFIGLIINTWDEAAATDLADRFRLVVEQGPEPVEVRHNRDGLVETWAGSVRYIEVLLERGRSDGPGKPVPAAAMLTVQNPVR